MKQKRTSFKERLRIRRLRGHLTAGIAGAIALSASGQVFELKSANPLNGVSGNDVSNPTFVDVDLDGDQDLFLAGNSRGNTETARENALQLFENVNGAWVRKNSPFQDSLEIESILDTIAVDVSPQFLDFDGDGDFDAFLGLSTGGVKYYQNDAGTFNLVSDASDPFSDLEFEEGRLDIATGDINNDGSTQLIITDGGTHTLYGLVDGKFVADNEIGFDDSSTGTLHDIDEDGDLDFIVGNKYGEIIFYENVNGVLTENDDANPLGEVDFSEYINPAFADGEVDLILGNSRGDVFLLKNTSEGYQHISQNIQGISADTKRYVNPEFVDIDGDGD